MHPSCPPSPRSQTGFLRVVKVGGSVSQAGQLGFHYVNSSRALMESASRGHCDHTSPHRSPA